jgi:hypothetical protein
MHTVSKDEGGRFYSLQIGRYSLGRSNYLASVMVAPEPACKGSASCKNFSKQDSIYRGCVYLSKSFHTLEPLTWLTTDFVLRPGRIVCQLELGGFRDLQRFAILFVSESLWSLESGICCSLRGKQE